MKKKLYLFVVLLVILLVILFSLARNKIRNATYVILFGSEKQNEKMYTPLVEEKFDFSKLGNKKIYRIFPEYFGKYTISVRIAKNISKPWKDINMYTLYFSDCVKMKISVEDKIIFERILKEKDLPGISISKTSMGIILHDFEIKKEYLEKKITLELEVVNTNENLIKYINKKTLIVRVGPNL